MSGNYANLVCSGWKGQIGLLVCLHNVATSVSVVDQGVEGLVEPLPKNYCWGCFVEGDHSACYKHVHWNLKSIQKRYKIHSTLSTHLSRHSSNQHHFFSRIWMKGRVVKGFGAPQIFFSGLAWQFFSAPGTVARIKWFKIAFFRLLV